MGNGPHPVNQTNATESYVNLMAEYVGVLVAQQI